MIAIHGQDEFFQRAYRKDVVDSASAQPIEPRAGLAWVETHPITGARRRFELIRPMKVDELAADPVGIQTVGAMTALRLREIPRVLDATFLHGHLAIVTENVDGISAREFLRRDPTDGPRRILSAIPVSTFAVQYAMDRGIYHPYFDLDSIVFTDTGEIRILGVGIAQLREGCALSADRAEAQRKTRRAFERALTVVIGGWV